MCGIAGVFGRREPDIVGRMLATMRHRGPDDEHLIAMPEITFGARRLSIIDLEGGRQPLSDAEGSVWAAQNGEIYNFQELSKVLVSRGHRFRSRTDTEVLVHGYKEWGADLPLRLRGMFAFAVWDSTRHQGMLVRDRVGKKPLYLWSGPDGALWFASEIKALLGIPGFERRLNRTALHHYLSYKHVPAPLSIFEGVRAVPAGTRIRIDGTGCKVEDVYWSPRFAPQPAGSVDEAAERILSTLRTAVRRRLISDVPVGFFLSGGIDSALVAALAAEESAEPIRTFTLTYGPDDTTEGKERDRASARLVAARIGSKHVEEEVAMGNLRDEFPRILSAFDEPFAGVVSTYFLSREMARHVKVALSGDGADELFGSYLSHRLAQPIAHYLRQGREGSEFGYRPFETRIDYLASLAHPDPWEWRSRLGVFSEEEKRVLLLNPCEESTPEHWKRYFAGTDGHDPLNRILEAEFRGIFPDQVLAFVDRLSMAHSLEVRCPFLDHEFVELAGSIPGSWKIEGGIVKAILKRAALRILPEDLVHRPKEGFLMPMTPWLAGAGKDHVHDVLSPRAVRQGGVFRPERVEAILNRFFQGETELGQRVLTLLAFQTWQERYRCA